MNWEDVRVLFSKCREDSERRSDDVIEIWEAIEAILEDKKTGNDRHSILEQVFVAALDTSRFDIASRCIHELDVEFPGSVRVCYSHLVNQRLAEIRYTLGGIENIDLSRTYYSQALKLNPNNLRALYGIYLCCSGIANSKALEPKRKEAYKTAQWVLEEANKRTSEVSIISNNDQIIASLESALDNLEINS